jgi:hypothetical protein
MAVFCGLVRVEYLMRLAFRGAVIGAARLLIGLKRPLIMEIEPYGIGGVPKRAKIRLKGRKITNLRDEIGELSFSS